MTGEVVIPSTGEPVRQRLPIIDPSTGEIVPGRHLTTSEALAFQPRTPVEMEYVIEELGQSLDRAAVALGELIDLRYEAETAYVRAKSEARTQAPGGFAADKTAYADLHSIDELEHLNNCKAALHKCEALERVVRDRLMSALNLNKSVTTAYNGAGMRH